MRIFYGTRTHRQISQITHELAKTAYSKTPLVCLSFSFCVCTCCVPVEIVITINQLKYCYFNFSFFPLPFLSPPSFLPFSSSLNPPLPPFSPSLSPTSMDILASRDHTCIHPEVSRSRNKKEECKILTDYKRVRYTIKHTKMHNTSCISDMFHYFIL